MYHGLDNAESTIALALLSTCPLPCLSWAGVELFTLSAAQRPPPRVLSYLFLGSCASRFHYRSCVQQGSSDLLAVL